MKRKTFGRRGFTLLEIIACLAILGVVLGYLLFIQEKSQDLALENQDARMARLLAQKKLEEILILGIEKTGSSGKFEENHGIVWQVHTSPFQPMEGISMEKWEIEVKYGKGGKKSYQLVFWKRLPGGGKPLEGGGSAQEKNPGQPGG